MSKMGEFYIKKLNDDRDERESLFERSDCCVQPVEWGMTHAGPTSPPEPFAVCSMCEAKCSVIYLTAEEIADE